MTPAIHPVTLESSEGGYAPLPNLPPRRIAPAKPALGQRNDLTGALR